MTLCSCWHAVKQRMRSVQNIAKITSAMKMVAASKMRVAQINTEKSRGLLTPFIKLLGDLPGMVIAVNRQAKSLPFNALLCHAEVQNWNCRDSLGPLSLVPKVLRGALAETIIPLQLWRWRRMLLSPSRQTRGSVAASTVLFPNTLVAP